MSSSPNVTSMLGTLAPEGGINLPAALLKSTSSPRVAPKLRVGALLDGGTMPVWIRRTLEEIGCSEHSELALIIQNCDKFKKTEPHKSSFPQFWHRVRKRLLTKPTATSGKPTENSLMEPLKAQWVVVSDNSEANHGIIQQIKAANLD